MDQQEIERRFVYHPPNDATRDIHNQVRAETLQFAGNVNDILADESREMDLFWSRLEEAAFWLHAHIARNL